MFSFCKEGMRQTALHDAARKNSPEDLAGADLSDLHVREDTDDVRQNPTTHSKLTYY
jgi:hypothetical protein